ncbi:hypothetical protein ACR71G_22570 [Xenorhabdus bovienii]|uniref:Uncharacterized protein n=1 Tax=Xenorhabdus bovienii str. kraussei Becker Underwood TaxID=1398204 RepID=A0A077PHX8_XENBV|nr:hypothetical protein XBKB1_2250004 [Xenorhabdus bovienii str. kraussei Becker Underwood]
MTTRTAGARDTVRYTEDEWLLQNLSYWLMAKIAPVTQPSGTTLCNDFKSKPNIQVAPVFGYGMHLNPGTMMP